MQDPASIASLAIFGVLSIVAFLFLLFFAVPLTAAVIASISPSASIINSALYIGNVWHTRLHPRKHAFTYPIFMFALDLEELDAFQQTIWPLSIWVAKFRETDHLKNEEGLRKPNGGRSGTSQTNGNDAKGLRDSDCNSIVNRVFRLVAQRTSNKFKPNLERHRVMILTHLCYYGYNFNPVSFYYVIDKKSDEIVAVIGEVSNTPWTEMHCYVLHPDSVDKVETKTKSDNHGQVLSRKVAYSFPKEFHVSPFMEMDYWYDWSFFGVPGTPRAVTDNAVVSSEKGNTSPMPITVINTLRRRGNDRIDFTAKLVMESHPITPFQIAWQMIRLPVFCMIIQIWIHYQAALLFLKGIVYIPHPEESETTASRIIATVMVPFFAIRDLVNPKCKTA
uniref:Uncharacterized protein n=1 Tax=Pseudo-nitzschia delicatissima TaxID=44447 RepID=A0A7S0TC10_9STRA|mmetsp:Transcript_241/g.545  ORF Transcript_241/g.545 Transcript_241/m.545 type:complete len:391 (+) Transcript_241:158-1330(+)